MVIHKIQVTHTLSGIKNIQRNNLIPVAPDKILMAYKAKIITLKKNKTGQYLQKTSMDQFNCIVQWGSRYIQDKLY